MKQLLFSFLLTGSLISCLQLNASIDLEERMAQLEAKIEELEARVEAEEQKQAKRHVCNIIRVDGSERYVHVGKGANQAEAKGKGFAQCQENSPHAECLFDGCYQE